MSVQTWTTIMVGSSFTLYIGIAIWAKAKTRKDFYVAGSRVRPIINGMATAADWMSAASFIAKPGFNTPPLGAFLNGLGYDGFAKLFSKAL